MMMIPTLDQTEGIWIGRTSEYGYHYIQDVFPGDTLADQWHRANCQTLIAQGHLQAEDGANPEPTEREWKQMQRYRRVHS